MLQVKRMFKLSLNEWYNFNAVRKDTVILRFFLWDVQNFQRVFLQKQFQMTRSGRDTARDSNNENRFL